MFLGICAYHKYSLEDSQKSLEQNNISIYLEKIWSYLVGIFCPFGSSSINFAALALFNFTCHFNLMD